MFLTIRNTILIYLLWLFASVGIVLILDKILGIGEPVLPVIIGQILFMGIPAMFFIARENVEIPIFRRESFGSLNLYFVIILGWLSLTAFNSTFIAAVYNLLPPEMAESYADMLQNSQVILLIKESGLNLYLTAFLIGFAPAFGEELLFRRYLFDGLLKHSGLGKALVISSLLFAVAHMSFAGIIQYFLIGLLIAMVYFHTRNILLAMLIHFLNNFLAVLALEFAPEAAGIQTDFGILELSVLIISGLVFYLSLKSMITGKFLFFNVSRHRAVGK